MKRKGEGKWGAIGESRDQRAGTSAGTQRTLNVMR